MREHILEVAKKLFIKNGYNATTTGDIVEYSGSSKGNLYYHFKTKENLFLEIINIEIEKWFAEWLEEGKKCQSNREKFYLINEISVKRDAYYKLQTAINEFYSREHESNIEEKMNEFEKRYVDIYYEIFSTGNRENEWNIEDVESASQIAAATINGIITFTNNIDKKKRMELMERFSQIFLKGVQ
ncbi:TetR/AcrR family transcriptional regulator [Cytobacillus firmus]|uniref:TetR/AcrR family transcriptional regulator n=1 Tax=Cytobacillus firmus TaxID=1399 RepID=UPI0029D41B59|nr:TetR family transcriptional regulator C-terminal domain-containing protein [Cytobacillus firmus]